MTDFSELSSKLNQLISKQNELSKEIVELRDALKQAKTKTSASTNVQPPTLSVTKKQEAFEPKLKTQPIIKKQKVRNFEIKSELEKFIGENLINKIGIVILIIGVAIGAKYSIENNLINPLTRIILGYVTAIVLLGFGIKLKPKYESFSAVLVSGAMAIFYFITFFAYDFYGLIPQLLAFMLMVLFTAFTVVAALQYNKQVIALIGLVGAYAVPLLLSDGSGKVLVFYSYIAIINAGLMVLAVKKYWKLLFYSAFVLTWLIFSSWLFFNYNQEVHFVYALVFSTVFFIEFYVTFIAYKLATDAQFNLKDVLLVLTNSFLFFGVGLYILNSKQGGDDYFGLFTLLNALLHFVVSYTVYSKKLADKNLFYLLAGLVLVFITIAIPIQLDGNWVTLLWIGEAALLFWIGRTKNQSFYEKLSYPLLIIAIVSIGMDWQFAYYSHAQSTATQFSSIFNIHFLSGLLFTVALAFMSYVAKNNALPTNNSKTSNLNHYSLYLPLLFIVSLFFLFYNEISHFWDLKMEASKKIIDTNDGFYNYVNTYVHPSLDSFKATWLINYVLGFTALGSVLIRKYLPSDKLKQISFYSIIGSLALFLFLGLYEISELRENYLSSDNELFTFGKMHLYIRYISFGFLGASLYTLFTFAKKQSTDIKVISELVLYGTLVWVASSELLHWMDIAGNRDSYKLALSILWGCFSLALIALGMWQKKKHIRIGAIGLFGITLVKLFLYDISHLSTISKTIVFVSLGVLLLIISFLYNKNKHRIFDEE